MKGYINRVFSLQELCLARVAIHLCQDNGFKEAALQLEKPTYGTLILGPPPPSEVDLRIMNSDSRYRPVRLNSYDRKPEKAERHWEDIVSDECQRLAEGIPLPGRLKKKIHPCMDRIALEYLCFSRKQELLFQVSRYHLMDILTSEHWKGDGRLDEEKMALRLLQDERLTVLRRYQIACVYCLEVHVSQLWEKLTPNEKLFVLKGFDRSLSEKCRRLVRRWSRCVDGGLNINWTMAGSEAIRCGNRSAVMVCWRSLTEPMQSKVVTEWAFEALKAWGESENAFIVRERLVHPLPLRWQSMYVAEDFNLPSYYSELVVFFLSLIDQEQRLRFLTFRAEKYLSSGASESFMKLLLEWPYQDDFIPTITQLWGWISDDEYEDCLMALAKKYSDNYARANQDYDYRSLLWMLWKVTPQGYKSDVLWTTKIDSIVVNDGQALLAQLLVRSPFQEEDQMLFKLIFRDLPQEGKEELILTQNEAVQFICSRLIQEEKWSFLTWLLQKCLSPEQIVRFKRQLVSSYYGAKLCLGMIEDNRGRIVDDLLYWCFESNADLSDMSVINSFLSPDEEKKRRRLLFAECSCLALLDNCFSVVDCTWKHLDQIVQWSVNSAEEESKLKKYLFSCKGVAIHFALVFIQVAEGLAEGFYRWFNLSPGEIKQLKWDSLFLPRAIEIIKSELQSNIAPFLPRILRYCLTDEAMVMNFRNEFEEKYLTERQKERLDEIFRGFRKRRSSGAVEDEPDNLKKGT